MTPNVGNIDRIARFILGLVLVALPFVTNMVQSTPATVISVVLGLVMIGTAATKFCLLYRVLGIQTCKL
jgi:hypothetical protein